MRDDSLRLKDMVEAVEQIEKYTLSGRERFDADELVRVWVLRHLEILGEACRGLSDAFRALHPDSVWRDAVSLRNVLTHQYFGIDVEADWAVVERDLPSLKALVLAILESIERE